MIPYKAQMLMQLYKSPRNLENAIEYALRLLEGTDDEDLRADLINDITYLRAVFWGAKTLEVKP